MYLRMNKPTECNCSNNKEDDKIFKSFKHMWDISITLSVVIVQVANSLKNLLSEQNYHYMEY